MGVLALTLFGWLCVAMTCLRWPGVAAALTLLLGRTPFPTRSIDLAYGAVVTLTFGWLGILSRGGLGRRLTRVNIAVAISFTLFCLGLALSNHSSSTLAAGYGAQKGLALLFLIVPLMLMFQRFRDIDLAHFLQAFVGVVSGLAFLGLASSIISGSSGRVAALGGGPIAFAQVCCMGALILVFWDSSLPHSPLVRHTYSLLRWPLIAVLLFAAFRSGSRGPLVAFLLVMVLVVSIAQSSDRTARGFLRRNRSRISAMLIISAMVLLTYRSMSSAQSRFALLSDPGTEIRRSRGSTWGLGLELSLSAPPWGHGFGAFAKHDPVLVYSHNFVLELLSETGWLSIAILLAIVSALRCFASKRGSLSFALLSYALLVAQTSGDLYNHRYVFVFLAAGYVFLDAYRGPILTPARSPLRAKTSGAPQTR